MGLMDVVVVDSVVVHGGTIVGAYYKTVVEVG